jgi:hypothetical protein
MEPHVQATVLAPMKLAKLAPAFCALFHLTSLPVCGGDDGDDDGDTGSGGMAISLKGGGLVEAPTAADYPRARLQAISTPVPPFGTEHENEEHLFFNAPEWLRLRRKLSWLRG